MPRPLVRTASSESAPGDEKDEPAPITGLPYDSSDEEDAHKPPPPASGGGAPSIGAATRATTDAARSAHWAVRV